MSAKPEVAFALVLIMLVGPATGPVHADVIIDAQAATSRLAAIAKAQQEANGPEDRVTRGEALFALGRQVVELMALLNADMRSHGTDNPIARVAVERLQHDGVQVWFDPRERVYRYDLAALREYALKLPRGPHVAEARFLLIENDRAPDEIPRLRRAIAEEEAFVRTFPTFARIVRVRFLLARDHLRLGRQCAWNHDAKSGATHERVARRLFRQIVKIHPESEEAKDAAVYLFEPRPPE